jgi:hypothetical protein
MTIKRNPFLCVCALCLYKILNDFAVAVCTTKMRLDEYYLGRDSNFIQCGSNDTYGHSLSVRYEGVFSARCELSDVLDACGT